MKILKNESILRETYVDYQLERVKRPLVPKVPRVPNVPEEENQPNLADTTKDDW